jgi:hypothetical protein
MVAQPENRGESRTNQWSADFPSDEELQFADSFVLVFGSTSIF